MMAVTDNITQAETRAAPVPSEDAPKRYWLIEQTDLDEDDDHRVIHTTDLDVYPNATILGEYVLKTDMPSDKERAETDRLLDAVRVLRHNSYYHGYYAAVEKHGISGRFHDADEIKRPHPDEIEAAQGVLRSALTPPDQSETIKVLKEALSNARLRISYLGDLCDERHRKHNEEFIYPCIDEALALAEKARGA